MNGFLLDTNVISMLSPSRAGAYGRFLEWLERMDGEDRVFLSVVTIHELEKGITLLESKGATAGLRVWLSGLITSYDEKILSFDTSAAAVSGELEAKAISDGHAPGMADAAIAGIAKVHNLIVVTHNTAHVLPFEVGALLPDEAARSA